MQVAGEIVPEMTGTPERVLRRLERLAALWIAQQHGLFMLWMPVFMAAGIGWYFSLNFEPPGILSGLGLAVCVSLTALAFPGRRTSGLQGMAYGCALAALMVALGLGLAQARTHRLAAPMLEKALGPVDLSGTVQNVEMLEAGKGVRLILGDLAIERLAPEKTPRFVRVRVREAEGIRVGQRLAMRARLNPPSGPVAPGAFDFQFYAWFRQIGAFGFAYSRPQIIVPDDGQGQRAERLRQHITERVNAHLRGPEAAMSTAMMNGEVTAVPETARDDMRDSGLAHILAISGSHVGVLAGFVFFALRGLLCLFPRIALYWPVKKIAALAAMVAATAYVGMVGALIPVVRAWLMTMIVLTGVLADRVSISLRLLAVSALIVMTFMPEAVLGASFQMSYAAVGALILFYEATREWWRRVYRNAGWGRRAALYILGICGTSVAAGLATAPFSLFHFQQFSVYGLLANLLALPVLSFVVMPAVVMTFLTLPFGLEAWPVRMLGYGDRIILKIAHDIAALPHAVLHGSTWPLAGLILLVLGVLCAVLLRGRARFIAGGVMAFCAVAVIAAHRPPDILLSPSAKLMAVRTGEGDLMLSSLSVDKFAAENWMRMAGHEGATAQRWPVEGEREGLRCDEWGCRMEREGKKIAFSLREGGQAADCAWADILVASEPLRARPCKAGVKVDYFDLRRNGAAAIWSDGTVKTVAMVRGTRPWAVSNGR